MLADAQPAEVVAHLVVSHLPQHAPGLEVRAGYSEEHLLHSQRTAEIGSAREIAEAWRQAVLAKGGFTELTGEQTPRSQRRAYLPQSRDERLKEFLRAPGVFATACGGATTKCPDLADAALPLDKAAEIACRRL